MGPVGVFPHLPEALSEESKATVDAMMLDDAHWFAAQLESDVAKWKRLAAEWKLRLGMQETPTTTVHHQCHPATEFVG